MSGPSFGFFRRGENIESIFLPWHRQWSHSFTMGLFLGIIGFLLFSFIYNLQKGLVFGLIIALSFNAHVACDLLGFMGGNLLFPFTKDRSSGFKVMKASNPLGNFLVIWGSMVVTLFNLNRFSDVPVFTTPWYFYFLYWLVIPALFLIILSRVIKKREGGGEVLETPAVSGNKEMEYENREDLP